MSVVNVGVTAASFTMQITPGGVFPLMNVPTLGVPLTFGTSTFISQAFGSFTPLNNTQTLHTFTTTNDQPKWFFLLVDQPIQLTATLSGALTPVNKFPIQRFFFSGTPTPATAWNTIVIDGTTTGANYIMSQNVAVNYSLWWGDGSLS